MYTKKYKISANDIDKNGKLLLQKLFYYLQDVMIHNVNSYGASTAFHHKLGLAWVLVDYDIDITELPSLSEEVTFGTLPYSFKRYYGYRIYEAQTDKGVFLKGKARFVLMDFVHKTLALPSQEILDLFTDASKEPKSLPISKHRLFKGEPLKTTTLEVTTKDIDSNNHMNNIKYLEHAIDSLNGLDIDLGMISNVRITYKKECYLNDVLELFVVRENQTVQVQIYKDGKNISVVSFVLKNPLN